MADELDNKVYQKAVELLSLRLHTTGELQKKLKTRGFKDEDIVPILHRLEELDFLNDERFAQIFVDNLKRYKDFGYYGIRAKLAQRQIPSDIAAAALKEFFTAEDESVVAKRLLKKIAKKTYEQKARALSTRGFRSEILRKVLRPDSD